MNGESGTAVYKLSGAGNDFLALVEPADAPDADRIRAWCRRGLSLGADGLFTLARREGAAVMTHYNPDGERSELCLNGSRCAARLAFHLGWNDGELDLATDAGVLRARRAGRDRIALELPGAASTPEAKTLDFGGTAYAGWFVTVGVPHFVLPWPESLARAPVGGLGAVLRAHPDLGAAGANVNFIRWIAPARCEVRTFERGVEAETLACGTGVVATAAAGLAAGRLELPVAVLTAGGYTLTVRGENAPRELEGDARIVARLETCTGAAGVRPAARWSP